VLDSTSDPSNRGFATLHFKSVRTTVTFAVMAARLLRRCDLRIYCDGACARFDSVARFKHLATWYDAGAARSQKKSECASGR
jgi:hypothetical protein